MISYSWDVILLHVARKISDIVGMDIQVTDLLIPPDVQLGDIAFGCFAVAKEKKVSPVDIAKKLEKEIQKDHTVDFAKAAGPYINITLLSGEFIARIIQDVVRAGKKFGIHTTGKGKSIMLEYAQPNTHKEVHIGHVRNLLIGSSLDRLLKSTGYKTIPVSYQGDVGAHVSKCLWFLVREKANSISQPKKKKDEVWIDTVLNTLDIEKADAILNTIPKVDRTATYLGKLYTESTKLLEENPDWKLQVSDVQKKLETHAPGWNKVWLETRRWCIGEFSTIFQELGVKLDKMYYESDVADAGQNMVDILLKKGIARESQGAIIVDLEEEKLGTFVVRKSDGTSLYATKDLALAVQKEKDFPNVSKSLHIVDKRQEFYFKQLFRVLILMGYELPLEYVGYEVVKLATGAMSSREGNTVTWKSLRDDVVEFATKETHARHPDWVDGRITHTAWCLAIGGIKFSMLKQDVEKIFIFDLKRALSFDGDTGPYVQYSATRLSAILKKAGWNATEANMKDTSSVLHEPAEKNLALCISTYPAVVKKAAEELRPSLIAHWCITMSGRINEFYRDVKVLDSTGEVLKTRLQLVTVARDCLSAGLDLLGISLPEEM